MTQPNIAIDPTAVISDGAQLGADVSIGPYCVIGANVVLGDRCRLHSHVVVQGHTEIGEDTEIFPFASIGHAPQDLKYGGEASRLKIGKHNCIREHVTMNPGTAGGGLLTQVGDHCLFMVAAHVAHDCVVGDHVIMANNATIAGHVQVGDYAIIGGLSAVHQFVRVGHHAMIGGMSGIEQDVIPYGQAMGERAHLAGLNLIGLKRRQFSREDIHALRAAYRMLFSPEGTLQERIEDTAGLFSGTPCVAEVLQFLNSDSSRAVCQPSEPALSTSSN
jgi:UDP-N-acetylglucosamine acyltransferase